MHIINDVQDALLKVHVVWAADLKACVSVMQQGNRSCRAICKWWSGGGVADL